MTNNLTGILLRFREEKISITCDIEGMFLQVGVNEADRDLLRFLWWKTEDLEEPAEEYRMTVHLFGATSSTACANLTLETTADTYEDKYDAEAANYVCHNFYVDGGLQSMKSREEAKHLIKSSRQLCRAGGFNLHKFVCNDKAVIDEIPEDARAKGIQQIDLWHDTLPVERTLGIGWCVESDAFQFRIALRDKPATHRGILSSISSVYDPLGLMSPFSLTGKKILRELCKDGKGWDDPISDEIEARWDKWKADILNLSQLQIPRCYKTKDFGTPTSV